MTEGLLLAESCGMLRRLDGLLIKERGLERMWLLLLLLLSRRVMSVKSAIVAASRAQRRVSSVGVA